MVSLPPRYIASSLLFLSLYLCLSFSICLITYLIIIFFDLSLLLSPLYPFFDSSVQVSFTFLPLSFYFTHSGHTFSPPLSLSFSSSTKAHVFIHFSLFTSHSTCLA